MAVIAGLVRLRFDERIDLPGADGGDSGRDGGDRMFLGIDVGTGGTRAVLVDRTGRVTASCAAEHAGIRSEHIGWAEQEPDDWWRAAKEALAGGRAGGELGC